jgi:tetratricopeptide (TPR) repeat protein
VNRALAATLAALLCASALVAAQDSQERLLAEANAAYRSLRAAEAVRLYREYLAHYPDRADVRVFLGGALLNLDQPEGAAEEANRAIALDPRYAKAYILAGRVSAAREQWEMAQDSFQKAQRLDPRDPDAWYFSGRAFYDANRFEPAIKAFDRALRISPEQNRIFENLGLAQDALGEAANAERSFRKAVELAGGAWRPYLAFGAFLFRQGRPAESLPLLRQALQLAPASIVVRFELARVLYHENSLDEAARVLEPALPSGECRIHNLMARIYSARGESGPAAVQVQAIENCKPAPEHL